MGVNTNNNRTINITSTTGTSWRENLSKILSSNNVNIESDNLIVDNFEDKESFKKLDVSTSVDLLMEKDVPELSTNNKYETQMQKVVNGVGKNSSLGGFISDIASVLAGATSLKDAVSKQSAVEGMQAGTANIWNPWFLGVPSWASGKSGLSFKYEFNFNLGQYGMWNAFEEVVKPTLNLMAPTLPRHISNYTMAGPAPHLLDMLVGAMNDVSLEALTDFKESAKKLQTLVLHTYNTYTYNIDFGNFMHINNCLIKNSTVKFSNEVDNKGYPIRSTVTLDFATIIPPALSSSKNEQENIRALRFGV